MARQSRNLELYNFTLTLGEEKSLLDVASDIVLPAFFSDFRHNYSAGQYFFSNVQLIQIEQPRDSSGQQVPPIFGVLGRFIKDTELRREQVYNRDTEELVSDTQTLRSSPSAIFLLVLNNHRLLYFKETAFSPSVKNFQTAIRSFVLRKYRVFIESLEESGMSEEEARSQCPKPKLRVVPLSNPSNLRNFVEQYSVLKSMEVKIYRNNSNLDNDPFFDMVSRKRTQVGASVTTVRHRNESEGLSKEEIVQQLEPVVGQANSKVKLRGKDSSGNKLTGSLEDMKIEIPLDAFPDAWREKAEFLVSTYNDLIEQGIIVADNISNVQDSVNEKLVEIFQEFHNN